MDITTYYAKMADTEVIQKLPFERTRRKIDGFGNNERIAFQNGDLVFERETRKVHIIYYDENYRHHPDGEAYHVDDASMTVTNTNPEWDESKIIWLPRRADLQFIYHDKQPKGTSHYDVLKKLHNWVSKQTTYGSSNVTKGFSMEKIWLLFVMEKLHNKFWNVSAERWENLDI